MDRRRGLEHDLLGVVEAAESPQCLRPRDDHFGAFAILGGDTRGENLERLGVTRLAVDRVGEGESRRVMLGRGGHRGPAKALGQAHVECLGGLPRAA